MTFGSLARGHGAADWIRQNTDTEFSASLPIFPTGGYLLDGDWLPEIGGIRRGESYTRVLERVPAQHPKT